MSDTILFEILLQLVPMFIVQLILLFGVVPLARRVSPNSPALWIVCSLIPLVGSITFFFLFVRVLAVILDRLPAPGSLAVPTAVAPARSTG
jgi:hypothetical protein